MRQDGPAWRTDLSEALRAAHVSGKDVLVEFTVRGATTAADGGVPTVDNLVYNTGPFLKAADKRFIPVRLTVTTNGSGAGEVDVVALAERHGITRIPSLVLMDATARPYASIESDDTSLDAQVSMLERAAGVRVRRDKAMKLAAGSTGAERAGHLHRALGEVRRFALSHYESTAAEVVQLDPNNALKLKEEYATALTERRVDRAIQYRVYPLADRGDYAGAMKAIDEVMAAETPPAAQAQLLVAFKAELLLSLGRRDESRRVFEQAITLSTDAGSTEKVRRAMQRLDD